MDAVSTARLAALRATIATESEGVSHLAERQKAALATAASRARQTLVAETHSRLETEDGGHRVPDRTFFLRPLGKDGADLWRHKELRSWYGGATDTSAAPMGAAPDFGGQASLGSTLNGTGYTIPAAWVAPPAPNPFRDTSARRGPEDALNTARAAAQGTWRAAANATHWSDREAVLRAEGAARRDLLGATGYRPDLVTSARPFKSRGAEEDAWRFTVKGAIKEDMLRTRVEGAREGVGNAARARETKILACASHPSTYW